MSFISSFSVSATESPDFFAWKITPSDTLTFKEAYNVVTTPVLYLLGGLFLGIKTPRFPLYDCLETYAQQASNR